MIPNQWYPILSSDSLKRKPVGITRLGERLVLWRGSDDRITCLPDRCSHRAAMLSRGRIVEGRLECPYHGLRFDRSGKCVLIPANGADAPVPEGFDMMPRMVREEHGLVWYWYGDPHLAAAQVPWFSNHAEGASSVTIQRVYPISFLRVMENMADLHHVPFVHRRTIPGVGPRVDNYDAHLDGEELSMHITLRRERGGKMVGRGFSATARLRLPCLGTFDVPPFNKIAFVLSATPIDAERTWVFVRYSQGYIPRWLGGSAILWLITRYDWNVVFGRGDYPTLRSQQLEDAADISNYHLYEADRAVGLWFAMVKRAMATASSTDHEHLPTAAAG